MNIRELIPDIYQKVSQRDGWFNDDMAKKFGDDVGERIQLHFQEEEKPRLRLSGMGPKCPCELWHSINRPELAEPLPAWANIKYGYGHVVEVYALMLAEASGHKVEGKQDALTLEGISGHRDCVIDGCLVDVKSCNSRSFDKFKHGTIAKDDAFGYLDQLDGYLLASSLDPLVTVKDRAYIFAVDQEKGHLFLYEHKLRPSIIERIREYKRIVELPEPPPCECKTVPHGKSGNITLGVKASYSRFKHQCFPNLRTFLYKEGPVHLVTVARLPDVPELLKDGTVRRPSA